MPSPLAQLLQALAGVFLIACVLQDVFVSVVVPRRAPRDGRHLRLSALVIPRAWPLWRSLGLRISSAERRELFLGTYSSFVLVAVLIGWLFGLIVGYGLLFEALTAQIKPEPETFGAALYFAGVSVLTLGFGDYVAVQGAARFLTLAAGASGLGLFAVTITFLFSLYGSIQRREVEVVVLEAGAGAPPSGVTLLETYAKAGILDDLPRVFRTWQAWSAEVLDSHLAYPILAYFRSSHDNDSWISSLGAVMDAATLVLTTIDDGPTGWAKLSRAVAGHCIEDLVHYFDLPDESDVGVERSEFDEACARLQRAGFKLRDPDLAWANFSRLRLEYAGRVNVLARHWATPPAQWIGDRSPLRFPHPHREQSVARPVTAP